MADSSDSSLAFFSKAAPNQWSYVLSLYKDVLSLKAAQRTKKKGGPEELIKLDNWYQEQLPKAIHARKDIMLTHEELVQIMKWKMMRGKYRPRLIDLVKINTELAVKNITKKAFRKIPNISSAMTALTTLKGIGPATASAILCAGYPEHAPYMADESMLSTPGIEATDYTLAEYINYAEQIQAVTERLNKQDPEGKWNPHKIELTLWTHYLARELKPALLDSLPAQCENYHESSNSSSTTAGKEDESNADKDSNSANATSTPNGKSSGHKEESNGAGHKDDSSAAETKDSSNSSEKLEDASDDSSQSSSKAGEDNSSVVNEESTNDETEEPAHKKLRV